MDLAGTETSRTFRSQATRSSTAVATTLTEPTLVCLLSVTAQAELTSTTVFARCLPHFKFTLTFTIASVTKFLLAILTHI